MEIGIEIEISLGLRNPGPVPAPPPARSRTLLPACPTFIQITPPPPDMEAVFDYIRNGEYSIMRLLLFVESYEQLRYSKQAFKL